MTDPQPVTLTGTIPTDALTEALADPANWNDGTVRVLVTLWPQESADDPTYGEVALRAMQRWGLPGKIEEQK